MITQLVIRHFKGIEEKTYEFGKFDLLVGRNNSGKSTILQALSIWSYSIDQLKSNPQKTGNKAISVILPNFSPVPVPEFKLLWYNLRERKAKGEKDSKGTTPIPIEIVVKWTKDGVSHSFGISIKYQSAQAAYIGPLNGWNEFHSEKDFFPKILYVPPFSGIEPQEQLKDISVIRNAIGKFQPGSVLRNILLRIYTAEATPNTNHNNIKSDNKKKWKEFSNFFKDNFNIHLNEPIYEGDRDQYITTKYHNLSILTVSENKGGFKKGTKLNTIPHDKEIYNLDIISAGTGFHQTLILFSFLEYYRPDVVLFDEPDAHLHSDLQNVVLRELKTKSSETDLQCIIATHSPDFINNVEEREILFLKQDKSSTRQIIKQTVLDALSYTLNTELIWCMSSPNILFVEGDSDKLVLRTVLEKKGLSDLSKRIYFDTMNGGSKEKMIELSDQKSERLKLLLPAERKLNRLTILDRDEPDSYQAPESNPVHFTWKWRSIDNFFLYSPIWKRSVQRIANDNAIDEAILREAEIMIDNFFESERLELRNGESFATVNSSVFQDKYGKRILFNGDSTFTSLFQLLANLHPAFKCTRELLIQAFEPDELPAEFERFTLKVKEVFGGI